MLSVIMSGLNVAQKDLQVASNNVANANTVGFKRSTATFQDVFSNDPSANPKTAVGSGAITSMISRNTSQGSMSSTDKVTDLAIAGRGYFTLASTDPETGARNVVYTRAGNFTVNVRGEIVDSSDNQLQVFPMTNGKVNTSASLIGATITSEKDPADVRVTLDPMTSAKDAVVTLNLPDGETVTAKLTQADVDNGFITIPAKGVSSSNSDGVSAVQEVTNFQVTLSSLGTSGSELKEGDKLLFSYNGTEISHSLTASEISSKVVKFNGPVTLQNMTPTQISNAITFKTATGAVVTGPTINTAPTATLAALGQMVAVSEYRGVYLQGISIDSKGVIAATYGDGSKTDVGAIALASFRNDGALKPIGNTKFIASDGSGQAVMTRAGAPFAGDILSGTLEQANVDITQELMIMLKAQQLYNGNARMLQAAVEVGSRITDKI